MLSIILKIGAPKLWCVKGSLLGVAICMAYLVGTMALIDGFGNSISQNLENMPVLYAIYDGQNILESRVVWQNRSVRSINCIVCSASILSLKNVTTYLFAINDSMGALRDVDLPYDGAFLGDYYSRYNNISDNISIAVNGVKYNLRVIGKIKTTIFPSTWIMVSENFLRDVMRLESSVWSMIILDAEAAREFASPDLRVQPLYVTKEFVETGVNEVKNALTVLFLSSGVVVALLLYTIMEIEISYSRGDMRVLSNLGAPRPMIMLIFLIRCIAILMIGAVIGTSLGVVLSSLLVSGIKALGMRTSLQPVLTLGGVLYPLITIFVFGVLGGIYPIIKHTGHKKKKTEATL